MSTKELMIYKMKAKGNYIKRFNENVEEIKLSEKTTERLIFSITGAITKNVTNIIIDAKTGNFFNEA